MKSRKMYVSIIRPSFSLELGIHKNPLLRMLSGKDKKFVLNQHTSIFAAIALKIFM